MEQKKAKVAKRWQEWLQINSQFLPLLSLLPSVRCPEERSVVVLYYGSETTSPPFRVKAPCQVTWAMTLGMNVTLPSHIEAMTPLG